MKRWLVTGARGQLGRAVVDAARGRGHDVTGLGHAELAVDDAARVDATFDRLRPEVVVNCAAWTDVDGCERDPARADAVNGGGAGHVAAACRAHAAALVHVSTDFVFDGESRTPYPIDAEPRPISAYGRSKLLGETAVFAHGGTDRCWVVRTSWVFGPGGRNFPRAILERARSGAPLSVVVDEVGAPTLTRDLAPALCDLGESHAPSGIFHAANAGECSRHEFAVAILRAAGLGAVPVAPIRSRDLERPARRPAYSVLDCSRLTALRGAALPHYGDAIVRYLEEEAR